LKKVEYLRIGKNQGGGFIRPEAIKKNIVYQRTLTFSLPSKTTTRVKLKELGTNLKLMPENAMISLSRIL